MSGTTHVEKGPIGKVLFQFAMPVMISQLLQEVYNITDCIVIGRFGGDNALASIAVSGVVLSLFINFFIGFSSGVSVITSRLFGEYNYSELKKTQVSVFRLVVLAGIVFSLVTFIFADGLLTLLNCPEDVLGRATSYLRICSLGITAQLIYNVGTAILRSFGDCKSPLYCFFTSCLINLTLDVTFVIGFKMGIMGAAMGTLISQWILAMLILRKLYRLDSEISLSLFGESLGIAKVLDILKTGIPAGMQAFFMSMSSLIIQTSINSFGPDAMAGMTLYAKLEGFLYLPTFAYGIALTSFVGQNFGAGRIDRVKEAVKISNKLMWLVIFPLSYIITFASPILLQAFTTESGILFNAHEAILFNLPLYIVYAINQVYLGAIKGLGKTFYPMICTLICYSIFRVAWCNILLSVFHSMIVVYLSYDVSFFIMLALLLPVYKKLISSPKSLPRRLPAHPCHG
ncbi:MAG: MATE family efflux transporter [Lachnospiraceae bacterium]|nr:MATE family efflux transporter [Lachnospiraceae bacterium]